MNPQELLQNGEASLLYEDNVVKIILPNKGAVEGHIIVFPKKNVSKIDELSKEEMELFSFSSNYAATVLFETLGVHGTNIIINEDPLIAHILGRRQDDGFNIMWKPKKLKQNDMDSAESKIKDESFMIGKEKPTDSVVVSKQKIEKPKSIKIPEEIKREEEKENYLIKQLIRIP